MILRAYREYRKAGLTRCASVRGQINSFRLFIKYAWPNFRHWWFWNVYLPVLKRRDPKRFRETMHRLNEALSEITKLMDKKDT